MKSGKIKFYNADKGYGFLLDDSGHETFLHATALERAGINPRTVRQDDVLTFDVELNKRTQKPQACSVAAVSMPRQI